jgi:hypothetical protein
LTFQPKIGFLFWKATNNVILKRERCLSGPKI